MQLVSAGAGPETSSLTSESMTLSTAQDGWLQTSNEWICLPQGSNSGCCCEGQLLFVP